MHERQRRLLVKTEERVHLRRQRECVPVAGENAETVVAIRCPVSPVQGLKAVSGVVSRSKAIAAIKEVDYIGEPLALRSGAGGVDVAAGISGAKLTQPDGCAGVGGCTGVAPGIGGVTGPDGIHLSEINEGPMGGPDIGKAVGGTSTDIAGIGGEPGLHEQARSVVMNGINCCIIHRCSQAAGSAASV